LDIFEHNEFRHLLHLRLDFKRSSPSDLNLWLSKKLLLSRQLTLDLSQESSELLSQHESDRQIISQIKQSLLALKATQNDELSRIKEEHEASLEAAD
jgi:hypothetical protein